MHLNIRRDLEEGRLKYRLDWFQENESPIHMTMFLSMIGCIELPNGGCNAQWPVNEIPRMSPNSNIS